LPVVGTDKPGEAPPGVSAAPRLFRGNVAVPRTTLSGLTGLSKRSARRSGDIGSPRPPRRFHDHEAVRRTAVRSVRRPTGDFHRLRLPLRVRAKTPSPVLPDRVAPPGVSRPFSDIGGEIRITRVCRPGTVRPRGFSPPRRVALPPALRTRWVRCRSWGSRSRGPFEPEGRDALPHPLHPLAHGALQPRTLRNTREKAPRTPRHLSPPALVPRPWFQSLRTPFGAHHLRSVAGAFAPARPLARLSPPHLGEP